MTKFTCKQCVHAGEPHEYGDQMVVECRQAPVTISGFPIVRTESWCSPGRHDTTNNCVSPPSDPDQEQAESDYDPQDYITQKQEDGTMLTIHIPTEITVLHAKVQYLERELEIMKRCS